MSLHRPDFSRYVRDFSAGYLDAVESDTLPPNASGEARNFFLGSVMEERDAEGQGTRATLRRRGCATLLNPVAMATGHVVQALVWFQPEGAAATLLAVCNGNLYLFDGVDTFSSVAAAAFTADVYVHAIPFKDNVLFCDGTNIKRWNGTSLLTVGFIAPTAAPALVVSVGGTVLDVGGIYEGFAVWYDSVMDHESSPSAVAAAVTVTAANRKRTWTKPAGAPPANVNFWRVYCRRTDTNELNYFLTATVAIGTGSVIEEVSDTARRTIGPKESSNDAAPAFALVGVHKGYGIGVKANESYYYVSRADDLESWNPNDKFAVERGSGKPLRSGTTYGTEFIIQKPTRTWRLVNDRPPFKAESVHTEFGNVGPRSAIEVERMYYAWDEQKGPYRTNLSAWEPLATNRITGILATLNQDELQHIVVDHDPENTLIVWAVPASSLSQSRRRHLLAFNYRLGTWVPPITGLEYGTLARWQPVGDQLGLYVGDYWGRVYRAFDSDREGVPAGATIEATVTSATSGTVTCTGANFYATGAGMAGLLVVAEAPSGSLQWRRIASNTADTITLDTTNDSAWTTTPSAGWIIHVGAVESYWTTPAIDFKRPDLRKKGGFLFIEGRSTSEALTLKARFDGNPGWTYTKAFDFSSGGGVWGSGLWGSATWGNSASIGKKQRINRSFYKIQLRFESYFADDALDITAYGVEGDARVRKRAE